MSRGIYRLWLAVALVLETQTISGLALEHHHPPGSVSEYIKSLEEPARAEWQKPDEVVAKLELKQGDAIADLGAGSGYFTVRFSRAVGPAGRVYAVDIEPAMLDYIKDRARREQLENIQTVVASPHDPKLPPASVDVIFICNTLHHISDRARYYPLLLRALRPGGRLINVDFHKRPLPFGPPVEMKIAKEAMIEEARAAGFRLVNDFDFLEYQYFLVFGRAAAGD